MTDLAVLGLRVESQEVAQAEDRLDDLTRSAAQAEKGLDRLGNTARHAGHGVNAIVTQQVAIRRQFGFTAQEGLNLSRQMADIGVTAAMGMNPLMIALQQGPQLFDILQMAAVRSGMSIRAAFVATGAVIWTALAPILPIIAGIGLAVGAVAGVTALAARSMNKEFGDLTVGMGLTEEQLEKVQNKGVTMGDVVKGTLKTITDEINTILGPTIEKIGGWFSDAMDAATRWVLGATKAIVGSQVGAMYAIKATWRQFPAMMADAFALAVNHVAAAVENMVNRVIDGYNKALPVLRALTAATGPAGMVRAAGMSEASHIRLGRMQSSGALASGLVEGINAYGAGYQAGAAWVDGVAEKLEANTVGAARDRIREKAGEAPEERAARAGRQRQTRPERINLVTPERQRLEPLRQMSIELINPLQAIADEMRLIDDLARDMAQGLSSAFGESGRALGDVLTVMTGYQSRMAQINLAESEQRLTAAQAARERAQAEIQSYGDMAAAARGFFQEGSDGYRILLAIEQVYRAQQLLGMMQAIIWGRKETAEQVAQDATKAKSGAIVAYVNAIKNLPFPLNLAAGAATVAALMAVGASMTRGPSGGSSKAAEAQEAYDTSQHRAAEGHYAIGYAAGRTIDVRVTADRDGLNAYVENTAERVAAPMAAQAGMAAVSYNRAEQQQAQRRQRQRFT
ncbi:MULTISPECIES: phage tail length tape measure family protein [unclassified Brevundimonas]|uniref:phage tail length tape measure family protein n=1 Tax=unclassified Brevundimonas TaxID=2622653 RepID=UPI0025B87695|nr:MULTISPECIES: phage tail length tape measure family protein [unclassified Brevundimonas]